MSFDLPAFDLASFDPCARSPDRRSPAARQPAARSRPEPAPAAASVADDGEVARLGEAVASLARQLATTQAAQAATARELADMKGEPARRAQREAAGRAWLASKFG